MNSSMLKGYLTGLILGDGTIDTGVTKRAFRIKSINQDFILKIKNDLEEATNFKIRINSYEGYVDKYGTNHRPYDELIILAHPYFNKIYHRFYDDFRNRIITRNSLDSLNWAGWANWYMSDGYIVKVGKNSGKIVDRRVELCTDRYTRSDVLYLKSFLEDRYGYKIALVPRRNVYRIRIGLRDAQHFLYNISQHVTKSFYYKLDMAYTYRPAWMSDSYYNLMTTLQSASLHKNMDEEIV